MSFENLMVELRKEYVESMPTKIHKIQMAKANQDWETACDEFHKLKGSGKTYGFPQITELCQIVEDLCQTKNNDLLWIVETGSYLLEQVTQSSTSFDLQSDELFQKILKLHKKI